MAVPNHFGLPERFKENLEFIGFKVFLLKSDEHVSIPLKDKIIHVYNKLVHKDKSHKRLLKNKLWVLYSSRLVRLRSGERNEKKSR